MRLEVMDSGLSDEALQMRDAFSQMWRDATGSDLPDSVRSLMYRPEFFGGLHREVVASVMRGPSEWTPGERELFGAFVSKLNQCPF